MGTQLDQDSALAPARNRVDWKSVSPYVETLLIVLIIATIQFTANQILEERARYTLMLIGTCYGTWRAGKAAGLFALLLSGLIGAYILTPQHFSLVMQDLLDLVSLFLYLIVGGVIILFGEAMRKQHLLVLKHEEELQAAHFELAQAHEKLRSLLEKRVEELSEIKRFVAEEELVVPAKGSWPAPDTHNDAT